MAQGVAPTAQYKGVSSWDIEPPQALFDTVGYELTAHYMRVQVKRLTPHPFHICKPGVLHLQKRHLKRVHNNSCT